MDSVVFGTYPKILNLYKIRIMRSTQNKERVKLPLRQAAELQERNQGKEDILRF